MEEPRQAEAAALPGNTIDWDAIRKTSCSFPPLRREVPTPRHQ